jgi:hydrogenase nickel incorporation protein HypA/HybF
MVLHAYLLEPGRIGTSATVIVPNADTASGPALRGRRLCYHTRDGKIGGRVHEVGLVADALRVAVDAAASVGARRIERLTFALSPAGHATEDGVVALVTALGRGTPAEGAEIAIEWREAHWRCWSCGEMFWSAKDARCPRCAEPALSLDDEPELYLRSIDVPDGAAGGCAPGELLDEGRR